MVEIKDNPPESGEDAPPPRMKILGEVREGVVVVLDTETGVARLAYRRPKPRKSSRFRSFLEGFASAFDLTGGSVGRPYHFSGFESDGEAFMRDAEALAGDWRQVGDDLRYAMGQIDMEMADEQRK